MGKRLGDFPGRKRRKLLPIYRPSSRVALGRLVGMARVSGLTVAPEPPASHFTVTDLTIRDVLVILKGAGFGAVVGGIVIVLWAGAEFVLGGDAFWAPLSPIASTVVLVLAAILKPQFVANILAYLGKVLTTVAGSLERSRLGQRIFVGLMAIAVLGAWALTPYVGIPLLGAILGAGDAYGEIRHRREAELATDEMV